MGIFNLGGSKSRSSSQSSSYGYSGSVSSDVSRSSSEGVSGGSSQSSTLQNVFGADVFQQLFGGALDATKRASLSAPMLADTAQMLFTGGTKFLENLGSDVGSNYLEGRITGENPLLNEQIGALSEDVGRFFNEQLNPAITSRAVAGGTLGGGRQGVAQGLAAEAAGREFTRGALELRQNDINSRDAAAAQIATNSLESANTGLGSLPMLFDLVNAGNNAELNPYSALSSILGGPTVLSQSQAQSSDFSRTTAQSFADAFSRAFGEQFAQSTSKSKSASFDIGIG